jgi:hypothetical protein
MSFGFNEKSFKTESQATFSLEARLGLIQDRYTTVEKEYIDTLNAKYNYRLTHIDDQEVYSMELLNGEWVGVVAVSKRMVWHENTGNEYTFDNYKYVGKVLRVEEFKSYENWYWNNSDKLWASDSATINKDKSDAYDPESSLQRQLDELGERIDASE